MCRLYHVKLIIIGTKMLRVLLKVKLNSFSNGSNRNTRINWFATFQFKNEIGKNTKNVEEKKATTSAAHPQ